MTVDYLVGDGDLVLEAVEFRRKRLISTREDARVEARVLHLLERNLTVEELLRLPSVAWDKPREAPWPVVHNLSEAERTAFGLRIHWGLGLDPILNLVELLEGRGINAPAMDLPTSMVWPRECVGRREPLPPWSSSTEENGANGSALPSRTRSVT